MAKNISKYSSLGKQTPKLVQKFDGPTLDLMCAFAISNNEKIKKSHLRNLKELMSRIDISDYNDTRINKIEFINKILDARLNKNLEDPRLILAYITGGALVEEPPIDVESFSELTSDELMWINSTISDALSYSAMDKNAKDLIEMISKYQSGEYKYKKDAMNDFAELIEKTQTDIRNFESQSQLDEDIFFLSRDYEDTMRMYYRKHNSPSNKLLCGMRGFNFMLNGGFESDRVYLYFGLQGEGKSSTLLNLALQITRYNPHVKPKDPEKIPCVVMLSMENSGQETVERIWNMTVTVDDMSKYDEDDFTEMMFHHNPETNIEFVHIYRPANSENTNYLYKICDVLKDKGYEVICVVQDYVKVIRPVEYTGELRLDLGNVIKEFKVFATNKHIPVITASQLNRDGARHIDEARRSNKADLVLLLGRDNIGESMVMLDYADGAYIIAPEVDYNGDRYLGVQRIKARYRTDGVASIEYLYQPYNKFFPLTLLEDELSTETVFKQSMRPPVETNGIPNAQTLTNVSNVVNAGPCDLRVDNKPSNSNLSGVLGMQGTIYRYPNMDDIIKPKPWCPITIVEE